MASNIKTRKYEAMYELGYASSYISQNEEVLRKEFIDEARKVISCTKGIIIHGPEKGKEFQEEYKKCAVPVHYSSLKKMVSKEVNDSVEYVAFSLIKEAIMWLEGAVC